MTQVKQGPTKDRAAWIESGHLLKSQGHLDEAIEAYREAVGQDETSAESWRFLGNAYYCQLNFIKALDAYKMSARQDPKQIKIWKNLGNTYKQLGCESESIASFEIASQLDLTETPGQQRA